MKICPICGARLRDDRRKCPQCRYNFTNNRRAAPVMQEDVHHPPQKKQPAPKAVPQKKRRKKKKMPMGTKFLVGALIVATAILLVLVFGESVYNLATGNRPAKTTLMTASLTDAPPQTQTAEQPTAPTTTLIAQAQTQPAAEPLPEVAAAALADESWISTSKTAIEAVKKASGKEMGASEPFFWFQDMDMDGTPELIVAYRHIYSIEAVDKEMPTLDYVLFTYQNGAFYYHQREGGKPGASGCLPGGKFLRLFKNNNSGSYVYVGETDTGARRSIMELRLGAEKIGNTIGYDSMVERLSVDENGKTPMVKGTAATAEQFENAYTSYFERLTPYKTNTLEINLKDYETLNPREKQDMLYDAYSAWSCFEDSTLSLPLADVTGAAPVQNEDSTESSFKGRARAYQRKLQLLESLYGTDFSLYTLADINGDDYDEMIVKTGTSEYDARLVVFAYENSEATEYSISVSAQDVTFGRGSQEEFLLVRTSEEQTQARTLTLDTATHLKRYEGTINALASAPLNDYTPLAELEEREEAVKEEKKSQEENYIVTYYADPYGYFDANGRYYPYNS